MKSFEVKLLDIKGIFKVKVINDSCIVYFPVTLVDLSS